MLTVAKGSTILKLFVGPPSRAALLTIRNLRLDVKVSLIFILCMQAGTYTIFIHTFCLIPICVLSHKTYVLRLFYSIFSQLKLCRTYLKEHLDPIFVRRNPLRTVPFLDDNGFYLTDSHAITQYLVETKAPASTLIGHTPQEKALLNDRLYFDNLLFHKTRAIIVRNFI